MASACAGQGNQPTRADLLSVHQLNDARSTYAGKTIAVEGKVYVQTRSNLLTCPADQPCPKYHDALLMLSDRGSAQISPDQLLPLYRRSASTGIPEQIQCKILSESGPTFDCGGYVNGTVVTIEGTFTREQVPDQVVGDSTGRSQVISYRDVYYLIVS